MSKYDRLDCRSDEYPVRWFIGGLFLIGLVGAPVFTIAITAALLALAGVAAAWFGTGWLVVNTHKALIRLPCSVMALIALAPFAYLAWWALS